LTLAGTLKPLLSVPIGAGNLELNTPLNSWVSRGQVIGVADSEASPEEINEARLLSEEAKDAVAEGQEKIRELDADLESARADVSYVEAQLVSAENAELETKQESSHRELLFRQRLASQLDYDAAVSRRDAAASAVAAVQSHLGATLRRIDELERSSLAAQSMVTEKTARSREAEVEVQQMEENRRRVPVVSPADGLIIASDTVPGTFGIATDPTRLRAYAQVRQRDIMSVRIGEEALIVIPSESAVNMDAKVTEIGEVLTNSAGGPAYPIALSVQNPTGKQFAGGPVRVILRGTQQ
jgi:multidrug resistance efflux pump